ncbi:DUF2845 domain-containing protein [Pyxidicoccus parkwayensis]|uniref:DUF2845 domain-containing protein n=1 Tax=Pyxidicoccus parkwayensis TaxID=2813578 RepID=A0ABX7NSF9_9BACT|nr:DUF2845 domain-containing protein [Pyxidicoccus parkwaysis]QSQ21710.1 DUF2845 domain-containing protein [Pyxidicoccus parkwaysis]
MRALWMAVAVSLVGIPVVGQAASMRCGTGLVSDGASKSDVVAKCGEPVSKESRTESEEVKTRDGDTSTKRVVQKTFEEWTYNFGPNRLMQVVVFENGKLIEVKSTGYGR